MYTAVYQRMPFYANVISEGVLWGLLSEGLAVAEPCNFKHCHLIIVWKSDLHVFGILTYGNKYLPAEW